MRAVWVVSVLGIATAGASADATAPARRLDTFQVGWRRQQVDRVAGNDTMFSLEIGRFFASSFGVTALVRYAKDGGMSAESTRDDRHDIAVGPRIYFEGLPDRLLLAAGAGALIRVADGTDGGPVAYPFVEAALGLQLYRWGNTDLEINLVGGLTPDADLRWIGLAAGLRVRAW